MIINYLLITTTLIASILFLYYYNRYKKMKNYCDAELNTLYFELEKIRKLPIDEKRNNKNYYLDIQILEAKVVFLSQIINI